MNLPARNILVLRFSAMGDVALLAPVLRSFLEAFPDYQITLATRPKFSVFFEGQDSAECFPADVDKAYSGFAGIIKMFLALKKSKPEIVLDLHDHLRTRVLCFLFRLTGTKIIRFNKGRKGKNALTRKLNKIRTPLPHTVVRYREAFLKAGFHFPLLPGPHLKISTTTNENVSRWLAINQIEKKNLWIGIAPFAAHLSKIWLLENYPALIRELKNKIPVTIFLFGGGQHEIDFFTQLHDQFPDTCIIAAGQLSLAEELALMSKLDRMICVDSSNMHLAALLGIPTLSIWGGTHPDTGFGPFGNNTEIKIQISVEELPCRPCSVYGKETCYRGDFACLKRIKPLDIVDALNC